MIWHTVESTVWAGECHSRFGLLVRDEERVYTTEEGNDDALREELEDRSLKVLVET